MTRPARPFLTFCLTTAACCMLNGCGDGSGTGAPAVSPAETKARTEAQTQAAALRLPLEQQLTIAPNVMLDMVFIPKGELALHVDSEAPGGGAAVLKVDEPFYIAKYEITQLQYSVIMDDNPGMVMGPDQPVNQITWQQAQTFCRKISAATQREFGLPTGAQWEFACRAFSPAAFYSGETDRDLAEVAWFRANAEGRTHPVGKRKPNAFGLYDMLGNVTEWTADAPTTPPKPEEKDVDRRVMRGGSWVDYPKFCRAGSQAIAPSAFLNANIGFRVVLKLKQVGSE